MINLINKLIEKIKTLIGIKEKAIVYRVQLDFGEEGFEELEKLRKRLGPISRAEVIKYALGFLKWRQEKIKKGYEVGAYKKGMPEEGFIKAIIPGGNSLH